MVSDAAAAGTPPQCTRHGAHPPCICRAVEPHNKEHLAPVGKVIGVDGGGRIVYTLTVLVLYVYDIHRDVTCTSHLCVRVGFTQ